MYEDEIKIIDNFFPSYIQREIYQICLSKELSWTLNTTISYDKPDLDTQSWSKYGKILETDGFVYNLSKNADLETKISKYVKNFIKIRYNIEVDQMLRMMLVYIPPNPTYDTNCHLTPHVDMEVVNLKNFLYYINDNDAETLFFDQKFEKNKPIDFSKQNIVHRVQPKQGRGVLWDGSIFHSGSVSRITKRLTLNITFI